MPETTSIVVGMEELQAKLDQLPLFAEKTVLKTSAKAAMQVIADKAAEYAPKKTGRLAKAIRVRMGKTTRGGFSVLAAAARRWFSGDTFYGGFQEFGWKAGSRKRSVANIAKRITLRLIQESRRARDGRGGGLAKKGTEFRQRQEQFFNYEGLRRAAKGDSRRLVAGRHFVERAFHDTAQEVLDEFEASAKAAIADELNGK